jgi:hypothetical protein
MKPVVNDALRYWELRRIPYNAILAVVVLAWVALSWPHFRTPHALQLLLLLFVLTVLANVCYCAAYIVDIPMQYSDYRSIWLRWRWALWLCGIVVAAIIANYWIADEVYPFVT